MSELWELSRVERLHIYYAKHNFIICTCTIYMTGLIWFVQVVHYPLHGEVGSTNFLRYQELYVHGLIGGNAANDTRTWDMPLPALNGYDGIPSWICMDWIIGNRLGQHWTSASTCTQCTNE